MLCRQARDKRGFSIVEVLVATGVSAILLVLLTQILIPGFRIWKRTRAIADLEQNARQAEASIKNDFLPTCAYSVTTLDAPGLQAVSFLSHGGSADVGSYTPEGRAYWRRMLIYKHIPGADKLEKLIWEKPPLGPAPMGTPSAFSFTVLQLTAACAAPNGRPIARKVKSFTAVQPTDRHYWTFSLELETNTPNGMHTLHHEFALTPRTEATP